ncbi:MAG: hypothetical protein J7L51_01280 [Desulfurococcales archaeon]|nr:hypothetical protein [Desulfurococcales archaeon]
MDVKIEKKIETKTYVSKKYKKDRLYFEVTTESTLYTYRERPSVDSMEISATLKCLAKEHRSYNSIDKPIGQTVWKLTVSGERCSLENSVMVPKDCKTYGIGTFLLHNMLKQAIEHFPQARLSCSLSPVDEGSFTHYIDGQNVEINNKKVRDSLYEKIGMSKTDNGNEFIIAHIKDLQIQNDFKFIKEIDIFKLLEDNKNQRQELKNREFIIKDITQKFHILHGENKNLKKYITLLISILLILLLLFIL